MNNLLEAFWPFTKPILFRLDPERAHLATLHLLKLLPLKAPMLSKALSKRLMGIEFPNPIGLAAGMDKNAECLLAWQNLGFGFIEVGTVTALPQSGNPKPRLFRILDHQALYNRMGFNNDGAKVIANRIARQKRDGKVKIPIGINIGKSAAVVLEDAAKDYVSSFEQLSDHADYIAINVSSPNTKDLRKLQAIDSLSRIIEAVATQNEKRERRVPLLIKIAPDLEKEEAIAIGNTAISNGAAGLIVSNTTVNPLGISQIPTGGGGLSGAPLFDSSTTMLSQMRRALGLQPVLIGSGGVMSSDHVNKKIEAGADLVQIYSGLVYGGPNFVRQCVADCKKSRSR